MPFRKRLIAMALGAALLGPLPAAAVGLGELTVHSHLFEPLDASIRVYGIERFEADSLRATVADQAAFLRAQIDRHPILGKLRIEVETGPEGDVQIRIRSRLALREPLLPILIDTEWPGGRLVREYTLMLDPPPARVVATSPTPEPVARRARPGAAAPAVSAVAETRVPLELREPAASTTTRPGSYGPIRRNEMLGSIARSLRPDAGVDLNQMMLALVERNPEAFILGNVNGLKAGAILDIPDREAILARSRAQAATQVSIHHAAWKARQTPADYQVAASAPKPDPAPAPARAETAGSGTAAPATGLTLEPTLPPEPEAPPSLLAAAAGVNERVRELEQELGQARSRLVQREEELDVIQTRMTVYGAELERLRQQLENYQMQQAAAVAATAAAERAAAEAAKQQAAEATNYFPWLLGGLLGGLGLSGLLAFLLGRRRQVNERPLSVDEVVADESFTDMVDNLASSTGVRESKQELARQIPDLDELPDTDEMAQIPVASEEQILSEVDVFVAYGLIERAREVLKEAIADYPDEPIYRERLRSIEDEPQALEAEVEPADEIDGIIVDSELDEDGQKIWARFAEMGLKMPPESDVIDLGPAEANRTVVWTPEDDAPAGSTRRMTAPEPDELDFTLPTDGQPEDAAATAAEPAPAEDPRMTASYEPTIDVTGHVRAGDIDRMMREIEAGQQGDPTAPADAYDDDIDGETQEWSLEPIDEPDDPQSEPPGAGGTEEHPTIREAARDARQPLRQLDHEATQMMRTDTQEERSAADFIVDWQMDQEDSESNTFDLPSDEELADLVGADETQQWELPPELGDPSVDDTTPGTGTGTKRRKS